MKKLLVISCCLCSVLVLQNCSSSKKATKPKVVSFEKDLMPIMQASCTPCHFPPDGRKEPLNNYDVVVKHVDAIIMRISLPKDNDKFMPWKNKKPALSDSLINVFVQWKNQSLPK